MLDSLSKHVNEINIFSIEHKNESLTFFFHQIVRDKAHIMNACGVCLVEEHLTNICLTLQ